MQKTLKLVDKSCEAERRKRERIKSNQLCEWISASFAGSVVLFLRLRVVYGNLYEMLIFQVLV
jgi:hypothetical protein